MPPKRWLCNHCPARFETGAELDRHVMSRHAGTKEYRAAAELKKKPFTLSDGLDIVGFHKRRRERRRT